MPDFDPYHKWLGIPPKDQPPNHYRLLAIELFESDPDVIRDAAEQRMAHVRTDQLSKHVAMSQTILNEIATAKVCLFNADEKAEYDRQLRATLESKSTPVDVFPNLELPRTYTKHKRPTPSWMPWASVGIGAVVMLAILLVIARTDRNERRSANAPLVASPPLPSAPPEVKVKDSELRPVKPAHVSVSHAPAATTVADAASSKSLPPSPSIAEMPKIKPDVDKPIETVSLPDTPVERTANAPATDSETSSDKEEGIANFVSPSVTKKPTRPVVVSVWEHHAVGSGAGDIQFWSNGHVNKPDGDVTWELDGNNLTLRWPHLGAVDDCVISPDGRSYKGKSRAGVKSWGRLVSKDAELPKSNGTAPAPRECQVWEWTAGEKEPFKLWLHPNGLVSQNSEPPNNPNFRWSKSGHTITVYWPQGWVDTMSLRPDGRTMSGHNQYTVGKSPPTHHARLIETYPDDRAAGSEAEASNVGEGGIGKVRAGLSNTRNSLEQRRVAENVFALGGTVILQSGDKEIKHIDLNTLPSGPFVIYGISFHENKKVTNSDLMFLTGMATLRKLWLSGTNITDAGFYHLEGVTGLEYLYCGGASLTDDGLIPIGKLTSLQFLGLYYTKVTNNGMRHLRGLTKLATINLGGTKVSDRAVTSVLPHCKIIRPK